MHSHPARSFRHPLCCKMGSWLAVAAVLLNALAPAVSQALMAHAIGRPVWIEVCTSSGPKRMQLGATTPADHAGSPTPTDPASQAHGAACAYCLPHAGSFGLMPTEAMPGVATLPVPFAPPLSLTPVDASSHRWRNAPARAPPISL